MIISARKDYKQVSSREKSVSNKNFENPNGEKDYEIIEEALLSNRVKPETRPFKKPMTTEEEILEQAEPFSEDNQSANVKEYFDGQSVLFQDGKFSILKNNEDQEGFVYQGDLQQGIREGKGIQHYPDGSTYEGTWRKNKAHGKGKLVLPSGDFYEGDWENNKAQGYGTFCNTGGSVYQGFWKENKPHGFGKEVWEDGSKYEGEYKHGLKEGQGSFCFADESIYSGQWKANKMSGWGKYEEDNGKVYEGEWLDGKYHGEGCLTLPNGVRYEGMFMHGARHGYGIENDKDTVFKGNWVGDKKHGFGVYVSGIGRSGDRTELKGYWEKGEFVQRITETERDLGGKSLRGDSDHFDGMMD